MTKSLISFGYLSKKLLAAIPKDGMQDMPKHRVWAGATTKQQTTQWEQLRQGTQGRGKACRGGPPLDFCEFRHAATEE